MKYVCESVIIIFISYRTPVIALIVHTTLTQQIPHFVSRTSVRGQKELRPRGHLLTGTKAAWPLLRELRPRVQFVYLPVNFVNSLDCFI